MAACPECGERGGYSCANCTPAGARMRPEAVCTRCGVPGGEDCTCTVPAEAVTPAEVRDQVAADVRRAMTADAVQAFLDRMHRLAFGEFNERMQEAVACCLGMGGDRLEALMSAGAGVTINVQFVCTIGGVPLDSWAKVAKLTGNADLKAGG